MRGLVKFLFGLILVVLIAWVGLWWYAEGRMESGFTAWASQLATQGWKVSYDSDQRGTSPLRATLTLTNLSLISPPDDTGHTVKVTLPSAAMRIEASSPLVLHTDLPNKINLGIGSDIDIAVTFGSISQSAKLDPKVIFNNQPYPFREGEAHAANIDILASQGSLLVLHLDGAAIHYAVNPSAGSDALALSDTTNFDGIALSPLMTKLLSIPFDGRVSHLGLNINLSGPVPNDLQGLMAKVEAARGDKIAQQKLLVPVLHQWAVAGGNGAISLNGTVGPAVLSTDASLKFDAKQQPQGTANIKATHLDQFFAAITNAYPGTQADIAGVEAALTSYLATNEQDGQFLTMHVTYGDGLVSVNGQKTGPLPPLDWNALANPAPPVAPATTDGSGTDNGDAGSNGDNGAATPGAANPSPPPSGTPSP